MLMDKNMMDNNIYDPKLDLHPLKKTILDVVRMLAS
jgi:hypothetical protein